MEERERLQFLLKELDISATRLANEIGIQPSTISNILSGRNKPSLDVMKKILITYPSISPLWLIIGTGDTFIHTKNQQNANNIITTDGIGIGTNENNNNKTLPTHSSNTNGNLFNITNAVSATSKQYANNTLSTLSQPETAPLHADQNTNIAGKINKTIEKIIILYSDMSYEIR